MHRTWIWSAVTAMAATLAAQGCDTRVLRAVGQGPSLEDTSPESGARPESDTPSSADTALPTDTWKVDTNTAAGNTDTASAPDTAATDGDTASDSATDTHAPYAFSEPFSTLDTDRWLIADWLQPPTQYIAAALDIVDGVLEIEHAVAGTDLYHGGFLIGTQRYGFGTWSVRMAAPPPKSSGASGTVCSFYLSYNDTEGLNRIGMELVGGGVWLMTAEQWTEADTLADGPARHNFQWPLDGTPEKDTFDITQFHIYTLDWTAERIVFYVDGAEIHRLEGPPEETPIPQLPLAPWVRHWTAINWAAVDYPQEAANLRCRFDFIEGFGY